MRMRACSATVHCHGCYTPESSLFESNMSCININIMDRFLMRSWLRIGPTSVQNQSTKNLNSFQIGSKILLGGSRRLNFHRSLHSQFVAAILDPIWGPIWVFIGSQIWFKIQIGSDTQRMHVLYFEKYIFGS